MPSGKRARLRIQQQPRRFAGARRHHHRLAAHLLLRAGGLIDIRNGRHLAGSVAHQFARHRAGDDREPPGLHGREDHGLARRECRGRLASASALPAIMAGGASVQRLGQHRHARRNARNVQLPARLLDQLFVHARRNGRQEVAVGRGAQALLGSGDADEAFGLVVPRRHLFVGDRPRVAEPVLRLKVVVRKPQRDAAVVIGAAADNPRAEPAELACPAPPCKALPEYPNSRSAPRNNPTAGGRSTSPHARPRRGGPPGRGGHVP